VPRAATKSTAKTAARTPAKTTAKTTSKTTAKKAVKKAAAKPRGMTAAHKAALAQGRRESRAINRYLDALKAGRGKRGRKRTPSSIEARLSKISRTFDDASPMQQLELTQERMNLELEKTRLETRADLSALEKEFISVAKGYAARRGISSSAFRSMGVPADVLTKANVKRTRG
jgi:hypothetical protein